MAAQDQFEAYFRRADLDGDGRISGAEAVSFFQGSNLPKPVLAQIWTYADQSRSSFLGRAEFFNALKLATVAQSKRDLTPEIVKAALYGPAAAKIPPPQINLSAIPTNRVNPIPASAPATQMGTVAPTASQGLGFGRPTVPNPGMTQQYFPSQHGQSMRPPQAIPSGTASRPTQSFTGMVGQSQAMPTGPQTNVGMLGHSQAMLAGTVSHPPQSLPSGASGISIANSKMLTDWVGGQATGGLTGPRGITPSIAAASSEPPGLALVASQPTVIDSKRPMVSGSDLAGNSLFGGDLFSATTSTAKKEPSGPSYSATSKPTLSTIVPMSSGTQSSQKSNSLDSLQSAFAMQPFGNQPPRSQSLPNLGQQVPSPSSSALATSSTSVGTANPSDTNQNPWPKMKPSDIQKYTKVFMEVDTDRDGRITGEQARNLFLSWRLPREVLKQVWDLSDQDSDSMLSVREFCFALYLMERYREGRPLPSALPSNVMYDETLLSMTGQPRVAYGNAVWGSSPGFGQQPGMAIRSMAPTTGLRPPTPVSQSQPDASTPSNQQKSGGPLLEDPFLNGHEAGDRNSVNSMTQDPAAEKKVAEIEKVILDSKEKIEYYRTKMQELVLYKSRCDNKLNEITERALADKREAEMLGKKYEEKYKQVAEVASKLTIEEATFRDIQARKMELNQAIVNVEQGGSTDGLLQVRADRIQSDLDELMKALTERSKKHGINVKFDTMIELPTGWQPGIQEGAATWIEDWDKFEDEGFSNDITVDVKNVSASSTTPSHAVQNGKAYADGTSTPDSLSNGNGKSGHYLNNNEHVLERESANTHNEDELVRSPQDSPAGRTSLESPSQEFSDVFAKSTEADAEAHSFDDSTWGAFDTNDDVDSVWGFNPASSKDLDSEKQRDLFGSDDFGLRPVRTESPSAESAFRKKSLFFEESVPGTPASRFGNSPRYSEAGDQFDSYSGYDSFSMHEGGFSPRQEKFTRFDSVNSTKDFGHSHAFSSFDDSDPFGSSGPFRVSLDDQTPKKASESWGSF